MGGPTADVVEARKGFRVDTTGLAAGKARRVLVNQVRLMLRRLDAAQLAEAQEDPGGHLRDANARNGNLAIGFDAGFANRLVEGSPGLVLTRATPPL